MAKRFITFSVGGGMGFGGQQMVYDAETGKQYFGIDDAAKSLGMGTGDIIGNSAHAFDMSTRMALQDEYKKSMQQKAEDKTSADMDAQAPDRSSYDVGPIDPKQFESYNMWQKLATGQGPSEQARISMLENLKNRQEQVGSARASAAAQGADARSQAAARGGLRFGAAERMSNAATEAGMKGVQGAYRESGRNMLDILKNDAASRKEDLSRFTTMEQGWADKNRGTNLDMYKMDIEKWAAGRNARAMERAGANSGGGGGK